MISKAISIVFLLFCVQSCVLSLGGGPLHRTIPVNLGCGGLSSYKWINLVQPSYSQSCSYNIAPYGIYVCQLLVQFSTNLPQPSSLTPANSQTCNNGSISIGRFSICGVNNNQHLYLPFDGSLSGNRIVINTNPRGGTYNIQITQVVCPPGSRSLSQPAAQLPPQSQDSSPALAPRFLARPQVLNRLISPLTYDTDIMAPRNCDQYWTASQGLVESFNWNSAQGPYIGNMQYTVCFRAPSSQSTLRLYGLDFRLGFNGPSQVDSDCYDSNEATPGLSSDYVYFPASTVSGSTIRATSYCGNILQGLNAQTTMPGTPSFTFNAGNYLNGQYAQRAWKFSYSFV